MRNKIKYTLFASLFIITVLSGCSDDMSCVSYGEISSFQDSAGTTYQEEYSSSSEILDNNDLIFVDSISSPKKITVSFSGKIDGDTAKFILPDGSEITCRFLAIDTPETVKPGCEIEPFGPEASELTENALTLAKTIELEYDPNSDTTDKYDRVLAWVFVDGELLQQQLVENGLAEVKYLYGDYLYTDILIDAENQAKENHLGVWS